MTKISLSDEWVNPNSMAEAFKLAMKGHVITAVGPDVEIDIKDLPVGIEIVINKESNYE